MQKKLENDVAYEKAGMEKTSPGAVVFRAVLLLVRHIPVIHYPRPSAIKVATIYAEA